MKPEAMLLFLPEVQEVSGCVGVRTSSGFFPCGKMVEAGSALCPRCQDTSEYHAQASARRAEKARRTREANKRKEADLASSPLAVNPECGKPAQRWGGGYGDGRLRASG